MVSTAEPVLLLGARIDFRRESSRRLEATCAFDYLTA